MNTSADESLDSASRPMFLFHHSHHRCHLPPPPVTATDDGERQFLQMFQRADHVAVPGSDRFINGNKN